MNLGLYRDLLKCAPFINKNPKTIIAIRKVFRTQFEKQRGVTDEEEHENFRVDQMRIISNLGYYRAKVSSNRRKYIKIK